MGQLYYRKLTCLRDSNFVELLTNQIEKVYGSPYDVNPFDLLKAEFKINCGETHKTVQFWCSSLIA